MYIRKYNTIVKCKRLLNKKKYKYLHSKALPRLPGLLLHLLPHLQEVVGLEEVLAKREAGVERILDRGSWRGRGGRGEVWVGDDDGVWGKVGQGDGLQGVGDGGVGNGCGGGGGRRLLVRCVVVQVRGVAAAAGAHVDFEGFLAKKYRKKGII